MNDEQKKEEVEEQQTPKGNMSVFVYILLLFSAALLLMCLSSLIHQRNNTEALGKLQDSVSVMQEVQNLQDKIIVLQEERRTLEDELGALEDQLEEARAFGDLSEEQTEQARRQSEAMRRLYLIQAQYQEGRYRACQASIEAFEAAGLADSLPKESPGDGVISPLDCYRQLQEAAPARIAEASEIND